MGSRRSRRKGRGVFLWAVGRDERFRECGSEYEAT
jgi:hypothetical protein